MCVIDSFGCLHARSMTRHTTGASVASVVFELVAVHCVSGNKAGPLILKQFSKSTI